MIHVLQTTMYNSTVELFRIHTLDISLQQIIEAIVKLSHYSIFRSAPAHSNTCSVIHCARLHTASAKTLIFDPVVNNVTDSAKKPFSLIIKLSKSWTVIDKAKLKKCAHEFVNISTNHDSDLCLLQKVTCFFAVLQLKG